MFGQRKDTWCPVQREVLVNALSFGTGEAIPDRENMSQRCSCKRDWQVPNAGLYYELLKHLFVCLPSTLPMPPHHIMSEPKTTDISLVYSLTGFSSASRIPSLTNCSGLGLCCIFCSRLSARMCFSRLRWLACRAGAAVESGRMFPESVSASTA